MSLTFQKIFDRVIGQEGGYVNHPNDRGGETNWGITAAVARENGYTGAMRLMSRDQAFLIYKKSFWERFQCEKLPAPIAYQFFDAAVNHGRGNAVRMLQRAVNVLDDGVIGPATLYAIRTQSVSDILLAFNAERLAFYTKSASWASFGKGWVNRIVNNLRYAVEDNGE